MEKRNIAEVFLKAEEEFSKEENEWKEQKRRKERHKKGNELNIGESSRGKSVPRGGTRSNAHKRQKPDEQHQPNRGRSNKQRSESGQRSNDDKKQGDKTSHKPSVTGISFTKLNQISLKDSTEIIKTLANSKSGLNELLAGSIKPDSMFLILKILGKMTKSDWIENKEHVLAKASSPEFFQKITQFVFGLATDDQTSKRKDEMEQFFENLLAFFQSVLSMLPTVAAEHLMVPLRTTSMVLNGITSTQNISINPRLLDKIKELNNDFEERKKEKEEREKVLVEKKEPVYPKSFGSIRKIPLYPRPIDIASQPGLIVPNKVNGPYDSVEHYLDVQFRLLREDFISPIRDGIKEYKQGKSDKKSKHFKTSFLKIYPRAKFLKPTMIVDKIGYEVCFDPEKRLRIKWEYSKRFIFGSLLLFSNDNFKTFFLATVVKRDLKVLEQERTISVVLCDTAEVAQNLLNKEFVMAESEVYFEPYYNVLKALQQFNSHNFPMRNYFISVETRSAPPKYTRNGGDIYTIPKGESGRKTLKLFDPQTWPTKEELGFDRSQFNAFQAALKNDLVVIQGPPGTGKTFLGLKITAALLENSVIWNNARKHPILVICFTNHALDQFLEGILENGLTNNLIRIGGRSKSELLEPFNLRERRKTIIHDSRYYDQAALLKDLRQEITGIFENVKILQDNLDSLTKLDGIVSVKTLRLVMSDYHNVFFKTNDDLFKWLLHGLNIGMKSKSNQKFLTGGDKEVKRKRTEEPNDYGLDSDDFENVSRLQEVLFDSIEMEELKDHEASPEQRIFFSCTLEEIQRKIEELQVDLNRFLGLENKDNLQKIKENREASSDLETILAFFSEKLKNTVIASCEESTRLYNCDDLNLLSGSERWTLYHSWIEFLMAGYRNNVIVLEERFRKCHRRYEEARQFEDLYLLQETDIVGVTTTSAARLQAMLRELKPKIVIVEEAAEVLEAHIIASLSVYCEHLILIGDHKQLRPSPADYRLARDCQLDISLFERLIINGVNFHTLTTQHRMRPEISALLVPTIYPSLTNHETTLNRHHVRGLEHSVFFMTHTHPEDEVADIMSKKNKYEARMVMSLARHLLLQGYRPDEITVLTTYSGQMYLMKEEQARLEITKSLQVTVVDNFQGEENRIILLSLVRSNAENRIGFLKTENRVCVALSRARDGLFVFGNMDCLTGSGSVLWQRIQQSFIQQQAYGPALVLRCESHPQELTRVAEPSDWTMVMEGGCSRPCGEVLPCGHRCKSLCHVSKDRHEIYRCTEPCLRIVCSEGHQCNRKCYQECSTCLIETTRTLDCGHQLTLPCHIKYKNMQCQEMVTLRYQSCGHQLQQECFRVKDVKCPISCNFRLECGHKCDRKCHTNDDPDHVEYVCRRACGRAPLECTTEGHACELACWEPCKPCVIPVVKHLPCGHSKTVRCNSKHLECEVPCSRILTCGHPCKKLCKEQCGDCDVQVEKTVGRCGHKVTIDCGIEATRWDCEGRCVVRLSCGHQCTKRCKDRCSELDCTVPVPVNKPLLCGHKQANVPCNIAATHATVEQLTEYCSQPCDKELKCEHLCTGTCGLCMQGRIHKVCDEICGFPLICGHSCPDPCRQICPPCEKPCETRCEHTKCPKKCGEPCVPCKEPCNYHCDHVRCSRKCGDLCNVKPCTRDCLLTLECGHACVGFCGDPCPPCKTCYPEPYEEFFFTGEETEEDAKWVLLNDCKHVVESRIMDNWLAVEDKEIKLSTCPKCRPTEPNRFILTTHRYLNGVKKIYRDIEAVKAKIFGQIEEIRANREKLLRDIQNIPPSVINDFQGISEGELFALYYDLLRELPLINNQRRQEMGIKKLTLFTFMAEFLTKIVDIKTQVWSKLREGPKQKFLEKANKLTAKLLLRKKKISFADIEAFSLEANRIVTFSDLLILESSNEFEQLKSNEKVLSCFKNAEYLVNKFSKYDHQLESDVRKAIQELRTIIKSNAQLSEKELRDIHLAMSKNFNGGSSAQGHWFKCPNGHPYCITECGGAVQIANCPERGCGAQIGGQNHAYLPGQQLFSEMDGATRPAWSSGYDMRNFDLDNLH